MTSYGDFNYESIISDNLLSTPFTHYIDEMAERDGLDSSDMRRKAAALGGSAFLGGFIGATLGGPIGFLMGVMGYAAGMAVRFDDEGKEDEILKAGLRAMKRIKNKIPNDIKDEISERLDYFSESYNEEDYTSKESVALVYSIISDVDTKAANLWLAYLKDEL